MAVWSVSGALLLLAMAGAAGCDRTGLLPGRAPSSDAGSAATDATSSTADATPEAAAPAGTFAHARPLTAAPIDAVLLASDDRAIYWISSTNQLWALPVGELAPRRLATGTAAWGESRPLLAVSDESIFWKTPSGFALHRTSKDGAIDEVVADGLFDATTIAVDRDRVYWNAAEGADDQQKGIVQALPLHAAPGALPLRLVTTDDSYIIVSLAAVGGSLYWSTEYLYSTLFYGQLWTASVSDLLAAGAARALDAFNSYPLVSDGHSLYYGFRNGTVNWGVSGLDVSSTESAGSYVVTFIPGPASVGSLAVVDGLIAVSVGSSRNMPLYVAEPFGSAAGLLGVGARTAAIAGPAGLTFVDGNGLLVAISVGDLAAAADGP